MNAKLTYTRKRVNFSLVFHPRKLEFAQNKKNWKKFKMKNEKSCNDFSLKCSTENCFARKKKQEERIPYQNSKWFEHKIKKEYNVPSPESIQALIQAHTLTHPISWGNFY